jgi:glycosyltransferase involved in cell wall biosynthesis
LNKKLKVLFITHDTTRSGAPLLLYNFIKWLKEFDYVEPFILIGRSDELDNQFAELGKVFYPFGLKNSIGKNLLYKCYVRLYNSALGKKLSIYFLNLRIKYLKIDLIYSNTICNGNLMDFLNFLKVNQICHVHEGKRGIEICGRENFELVEKNADCYIACSKFVKNNLLNNLNINSRKVNLIYSSINVSNYTSLIGKDRSLEQNQFVIGGSGGLGFGKGTDLIVPLMKNILKTRSNIKFVWVGGKKTSEEFIALQLEIEKNELSNYIEIVSSVQNPIEYYQNFDLFVLLSREDSFPLVCLEIHRRQSLSPKRRNPP